MCVNVLPECMSPETGGLLIVNHVGLGIKPRSLKEPQMFLNTANSVAPCIKNLETHPKGPPPAV